MSKEQQVSQHYTVGAIGANILSALTGAGKDINALSMDDLVPLDQLHGRGLEATAELAAMLAPTAASRVLDIGCGIGGPARHMASKFGCTVIGIDLTAEFCQVAGMLTRLTRLSEKASFRRGSATSLPFDDATFDLAYSQNVSMNIADKAAFYAEAYRVLRPGGLFATTDLLLGDTGDPHYPVPWAETAETSFLVSEADTRAFVAAAGLEIVSLEAMTDTHLAFHRRVQERIAVNGPPLLGPHVVFGERFVGMSKNTARNLAEGRVFPVELLCRRPGD